VSGTHGADRRGEHESSLCPAAEPGCEMDGAGDDHRHDARPSLHWRRDCGTGLRNSLWRHRFDARPRRQQGYTGTYPPLVGTPRPAIHGGGPYGHCAALLMEALVMSGAGNGIEREITAPRLVQNL